MTDIPLAGVIGWPVGHSRSPIIHGHWLRELGLAGHYVPLAISPTDFPSLVLMLPKMGFCGANVTVPHKETALKIANRISDTARAIGAANTLVFKAGEVFADNTDAYGFMANLKEAAPEWSPDQGRALVLGAGGAARAVVYALLEAGAAEVIIANRTRLRADELASAFGARAINWEEAPAYSEGAALVVNTTSLGMVGQPPLAFDLRAMHDALVTDIVYSPLRTEFLQNAANRGCQTVDGLGMLLHQAVPGFEHWFGVRPQVDSHLRQAALA